MRSSSRLSLVLVSHARAFNSLKIIVCSCDKRHVRLKSSWDPLGRSDDAINDDYLPKPLREIDRFRDQFKHDTLRI